MKINILQATSLLVKTISGARHQDFERVNALSKEYHALISGDGVDDLLRQYVKRESVEDFEQRKQLTEAITPAVSEKIMSPFMKIGRVDNVLKKRTFERDPELSKIAILKQTMRHFHGDEDLESYMSTSYINNSFTDPNSFIIVDFEEFDATMNQRPQPFPIEVSSENALNYKFRNNHLQWLIVQRPSQFIKEESGSRKIVDSQRFLMYLPNTIIQFKPIAGPKDQKQISEDVLFDEQGTLIEDQILKIDNQVYLVSTFQPEAGQVQAIRIGYKKDLVTKGRTFVSPLHPAINRLRKTLKAVSELDLTSTLHAHPHKYQYVERCEGFKGAACNGGKTLTNETCKQCNGSGNKTSTSAQDIITVNMPKDIDDMIDLSNLSHFESPPIDLLQWQENYTEKLEAKAVKDVFASETFNRQNVVATATEVVIDMQSVYDTLWPFANHYSTVWIKLTRLSAIFTDNNEGLTISHQFPKDFKMKTVEQLIKDLRDANESSAPDFVKTEISRDIAQKLFLDNPRMLSIFDVKESHRPFKGKTDDQIMFIIGSEASTIEDRVLWSNYESIFKELEQEQMSNGVDFFSLQYETRVGLLQEKVKQFIERTKQGTTSAIAFGDTEISGDDIPTPINVEAEAKAKLKGTVGGVQGIIAINKAVATGEMTEASAEALLVEIYGFTQETAATLIEKVVSPNA